MAEDIITVSCGGFTASLEVPKFQDAECLALQKTLRHSVRLERNRLRLLHKDEESLMTDNEYLAKSKCLELLENAMLERIRDICKLVVWS